MVGDTQGSGQNYTKTGYQNSQPGAYGAGSNPYAGQQYNDPFQQSYNQPGYGQNQSRQPSQYGNNMTVPQTEVKRSNGPAVAAFVFGLITLILLIISALLFGGAINSVYYRSYYNSWATAGGAAGAGICFGLACILLIFNIIFGIIGFIRGLKTKSKLVLGILGFVLMFINIAVIIWEIIAYVAVLVNLM